jgi:hypothetical protein
MWIDLSFSSIFMFAKSSLLIKNKPKTLSFDKENALFASDANSLSTLTPFFSFLLSILYYFIHKNKWVVCYIVELNHVNLLCYCCRNRRSPCRFHSCLRIERLWLFNVRSEMFSVCARVCVVNKWNGYQKYRLHSLFWVYSVHFHTRVIVQLYLNRKQTVSCQNYTSLNLH